MIYMIIEMVVDLADLLTWALRRLGTLFNATAQSGQQEKAEKWIKDNHPKVWNRLDKLIVRQLNEGTAVAAMEDIRNE